MPYDCFAVSVSLKRITCAKDEWRWVVGEGLISSDHQHSSVVVEQTVSAYQRVVRSQGLWMSFSHPTPFNTDSFSRLEALMAQEATVRGK